MEIERKFLLDYLPVNIDKFDSTEIEQAYVSYEPEIRIRKTDNACYLTKKSTGQLVREEIEKEIDEKTYFLLLANFIENNVIRKKRYYIPLSSRLTAEIDVYEDQLEGLKVVEVEFDNEESANNFDVPNWFGKEITYDSNYKNKNLSKLNKYNKVYSKTSR